MKHFAAESYLGVDGQGHLTIDGLDTIDLAERYGTPLYVISEARIRSNFRTWLKAFTSRYPATEIYYALKANPLLAVCRILQQEGAGFELGGPGELFIAELLGMSPSKLNLNGNNKSREELSKAIELGATINVDSIDELRAIQSEAKALEAVAKVAFRINPDVGPDDESVHLELWTGLRESKFGIDIESGSAYEAYKTAANMKNVKVVGIHTHIGSPVEDTRPYQTATERIMQFAAKLKKELGIELDFVNLGGGFAIPFSYKEGLPSAEEYAESITSVVKKRTREFKMKEPRLLLEPGGAIVGDAAILLVKVGMTKKVPGVKKWVAVDGGANVMLRASQEWYIYQFVAASRMHEKDIETIDIAGPLCYSGDVLARDRRMPELREGDTLAALDAGAYTFAYEFHGAGSHPLPPIVLVSNEGKDELIRRDESLADIVSREILPRRLSRRK